LPRRKLWNALRFFEIQGQDGLPNAVEVSYFLKSEMRPFSVKEFEYGWLQKARLASFLPLRSVAKRCNLSHQAYKQFEDSEQEGTISLKKLSELAQGMDCELVYAIRPKNKERFSLNIWRKLMAESLRHPWIKKCDQRRKAWALAAIATKHMENPKFKRKKAWSQLANKRPKMRAKHLLDSP
jgi:transcriptional regulator with XRE-family HTH domain